MSTSIKVVEKILTPRKGMPILIGNIVLMITGIVVFVMAIALADVLATPLVVLLVIVSSLYSFIVGPILFAGLKSLKPNEAMVLTLFGEYYGTLIGPGFFFVNPFVSSVNPASSQTSTGKIGASEQASTTINGITVNTPAIGAKKLSLKAMTLSNNKQKVNDLLGNPIIIGVVVIWRIVNTAQAVFDVDNYTEFLSIQTDSAIRDITSQYPYDLTTNDEAKSLRSSSQEVAENLQNEIQKRVSVAGLEIIDARITHLAYSNEIAAAMLQRQQAAAIIDARQMIVEGAVGMVEMALDKLNERDIVRLDEEAKAKMVSNLLVVLVSNKDVQPTVSSDSLD